MWEKTSVWRFVQCAEGAVTIVPILFPTTLGLYAYLEPTEAHSQKRFI